MVVEKAQFSGWNRHKGCFIFVVLVYFTLSRMTMPDPTTYNRIAKAIDYIQSNYQLQPSLDEIAEQVHLSPFHFQRLFTEWAGVSPKKFLQYISLSHAKSVLEQNASLMDAVEATGLSGSGRLHDLFINIEGMIERLIRFWN